jgi:hypothetical protein
MYKMMNWVAWPEAYLLAKPKVSVAMLMPSTHQFTNDEALKFTFVSDFVGLKCYIRIG